MWRNCRDKPSEPRVAWNTGQRIGSGRAADLEHAEVEQRHMVQESDTEAGDVKSLVRSFRGQDGGRVAA